MNPDRIKLLEQFAKDDPRDPFPPYALALELLTTDPGQSKKLFDLVLKDHPNYLPAYYHAGHYYFTSGDHLNAREILQAGVNLASSIGDWKTRSELESLLDEID